MDVNMESMEELEVKLSMIHSSVGKTLTSIKQMQRGKMAEAKQTALQGRIIMMFYFYAEPCGRYQII